MSKYLINWPLRRCKLTFVKFSPKLATFNRFIFGTFDILSPDNVIYHRNILWKHYLSLDEIRFKDEISEIHNWYEEQGEIIFF